MTDELRDEVALASMRDEVYREHKRQETIDPNDVVDVACSRCYIFDEGWPCVTVRLADALAGNGEAQRWITVDAMTAAMRQAFRDHDREAHDVTDMDPPSECTEDVSARIVALLATPPSPAPGLREALARAIEGGYADDSIDVDLYRDDPVYHAVVYEVRRARLAADAATDEAER